MSDMKLIMENWRKFSDVEETPAPELPFFNQLVENKLEEKSKKLNLLNELEVEGPFGIRFRTEFLKWMAIAGISESVCATALGVAAMYAGWGGVIIVLGPALMSFALNPVVLAIGGLVALRFAPTRKVIFWILKKFGGKTAEMLSDGVALVVDKMVESSNGALSKEKAVELFGLIAQYIINNEEFRGKLTELFLALKDKNEARIALISAELDDLVEALIRRDLLGLSEAEQIQLPAPAEPEAAEPVQDDPDDEPYWPIGKGMPQAAE